MTIQILLLQLPVPQLNFGRRTGNIPLAAACLQQTWAPRHPDGLNGVTLLPQASATYLGDSALVKRIGALSPDVVGFTTYAWNVDRTLFLARRLQAMGLRIWLGGPEITPDNSRLASAAADLLICGEGEDLLQSPVSVPPPGTQRWVAANPSPDFCSRPSPYLNDLLTPEIDDMVLLETQRGCPHACGYCHYGKGRRKIQIAEKEHVLAAARWAHERCIGELYLLDPSLDARPHLNQLLERLSAINADGAMSLHSEIRAEAVDAELANHLAAAGFQSLEIGLQSTNPVALKRTGRRWDRARFLAGTRHLQTREIACSIDLIIGLPGDTLAGFRDSIDFLVAHGLTDHLQVFPLAVLPGTHFRKAHRSLGLHFDPAPPYLITHTDTLGAEEIEAALDYTESCCGLALYPQPDLDIAWRHPEGGDLWVRLEGSRYIRKLMLSPGDDVVELAVKAELLTHPYQVFVDGRMPDQASLEAALAILTGVNPHTPLELVLLAPTFEVQVDSLLTAARLSRPHYLDKDLRYAHARPGNRTLMITLVSSRRDRSIRGPMCRQVFWWPAGRLPEPEKMQRAELEAMDGLLVGGEHRGEEVLAWQMAQGTALRRPAGHQLRIGGSSATLAGPHGDGRLGEHILGHRLKPCRPGNPPGARSWSRFSPPICRPHAPGDAADAAPR
jgi:hypothetical protein